jgi:hypothetical protein
MDQTVGTVGKKGMMDRVEDRFEPTKVYKSQDDVRTFPSGDLKWSESLSKGIRSQVIKEGDHIEEAEEQKMRVGPGRVHAASVRYLVSPILRSAKF